MMYAILTWVAGALGETWVCGEGGLALGDSPSEWFGPPNENRESHCDAQV